MRVRGLILILTLLVAGAAVLAVTGFQGNQDRSTVWPAAIDDVLYNPGMGFVTANAYDGNVVGYPKSTIAYWGWYWQVMEPEQGKYRWDLIDETINTAKERGQRVAIRIMPTNGRSGVPQWYRDLGAKGFDYVPEANVKTGEKNWMPDHNDPLYLEHMGRLVAEFGKRYDGHPDVDHVDMRSLGHWGEWHFAFVEPRPTVTPEVRRALVDIYIDNFKQTPLIMLIGGRDELKYSVAKGTGWRADCLGDLGFWGPDWSHMRDRYQQALEEAEALDAWKRAPAVFEACGVMQSWTDKGYDVEFIFNEALRWHTSIFNNKSSPVPPRWWGATERFLKRMGYRFVLRYLTAPIQAKVGGSLPVETEWENVGVAPPYRNYQIAFQLRPVRRRTKGADLADPNYNLDVRQWLPGTYKQKFDLKLPDDLAPGRYHLALAMIDPFSKEPEVKLAIEGRDRSGWYSLSEVEVTE
ncbi:DUF4832 domain-containing protein [candidate division KSB1 bacterium]